MKEINIWTDGGHRRSTGVGAFAYYMQWEDNHKEDATVVANNEVNKLTNQTMELTAVIDSIINLPKDDIDDDTIIYIHSDSAYVVNCFLEEWWKRWEENGYTTSQGRLVSNDKLWKYLIDLYKNNNIEFVKVKGHSDNDNNNHVDKLLNEVMDEWEKENL